MKKLFLICFSILFFVFEIDAELIGNIEYDLYESNYSAIVVGKWEYVEAIGEYCNYVGLLNADIPEEISYENQIYKVVGIADDAFISSANLISVTIPSTVKTIGASSFAECTSLRTVTLPNNLETIGEAAFASCENLTSINIPSGLTSLSDVLFADCSSLVSITLPNTIITIGRGTFSECRSLLNIEIPNSVLHVGDMAFEKCTNLTSVKLPTSINKISNFMFDECSSLSSLILPNSIKSIGARAFSGCSSLEKIDIPKNVDEIGVGAFYQCQSLLQINVDNANTTYYSIDGVLFKTFHLIKYPNGKTDLEYTIPNNIIEIGEDAFRDCVHLKKVNIPKIEVVGDRAFQDCAQLTSIIFPSCVTRIGKQSFLGTTSLQFIQCESTTIPTLGEGAFPNKSVPLYVPEESLKLYQGANGWCEFLYIYPITTEGVNNMQDCMQVKTHKYINKGVVYIIKNGVKYNALGGVID